MKKEDFLNIVQRNYSNVWRGSISETGNTLVKEDTLLTKINTGFKQQIRRFLLIGKILDNVKCKEKIYWSIYQINIFRLLNEMKCIII
jgi:hypothetical protein